MNKKISLQTVSVDGNTVRYHFVVSKELEKFFLTDTMFLRYDQDVSDVPLSILSIPFVNCMAGLCWLSGSMLFVDEIDETFYYGLKQTKIAYSELHDTTFHGLFVPSVLKRNEIAKSDKYLLLFGGGVDCHCSYLRNREHVSGVVNIYGWAKKESTVSKVDLSDKEMTARFAQHFGCDSFHVTSNFATLFNHDTIDKTFCYALNTTYWYGFLHSMAFLAISVPVSWLMKGLNLMIAGSFTKGRTNVHCGSYITTDSEFKFAINGFTIHDGFELSRQQKVKFLSDYQKKTNKPYLIQACSFNDHNCCTCEKCFRTTIELIAEGADPKDFGFEVEGSLTNHWKSILSKNVALWGVGKESYYYQLARDRMHENYENIANKEFVNWFLSFDFHKAKRVGLRRYYFQNFFRIIKRKFISFFNR